MDKPSISSQDGRRQPHRGHRSHRNHRGQRVKQTPPVVPADHPPRTLLRGNYLDQDAQVKASSTERHAPSRKTVKCQPDIPPVMALQDSSRRQSTTRHK